MNSSQNTPKIVFVTTGYPTHYRPHECVFIHRSIKELSNHIQAQVIHLRSMRPGRPLVEKRVWEGINVLSISCPQLPLGSYSHFNTQLMELFAGPLVRKVLRSADLINGAEAYPAGYVCGKWVLRENKSFTFNVIGSDLNLFLKRNNSRLGNQWLTNLKGVVCNSEALKNDLKQLMGEISNMRTIYRGIDTDVFSSEGEKAGPQASLQPVRFLYLGGFHTWDPNEGTYNLKGGHTLLEAWSMVENQYPSISLAIGGPGNYEEQLLQWRAKLNNPQNLFCINTIKPTDVANYIRASDVVIIPSSFEGLPNIAKEAQACGRPVLGTNVGGIPEVVENGKTGLIIPPDNPGALAAGIKWFYDNQGQIALLGKNGRIKMQEFFTWEQYRNNILQFFISAISKNP